MIQKEHGDIIIQVKTSVFVNVCMERTVLLVTHDAAELEVLGVTELLTGLK